MVYFTSFFIVCSILVTGIVAVDEIKENEKILRGKEMRVLALLLSLLTLGVYTAKSQVQYKDSIYLTQEFSLDVYHHMSMQKMDLGQLIEGCGDAKYLKFLTAPCKVSREEALQIAKVLNTTLSVNESDRWCLIE